MSEFNAGLPNKADKFFGKPLRVVELTSGSGTFTPLIRNSWCRVTQVGAGTGGNRKNSVVAGAGGQPGSISVYWTRFAGPVAYVVGAGGVGAALNTDVPAAGGSTILGNCTVRGGVFGAADSQTASAVLSTSVGMAGPVTNATDGTTTGGNGGSTPYGTGGIGAAIGVAPTAAAGYGAGGAGGFNVAGGNGTGGLILIEEFGA